MTKALLTLSACENAIGGANATGKEFEGMGALPLNGQLVVRPNVGKGRAQLEQPFWDNSLARRVPP